MSETQRVRRALRLRGSVRVPGDKSASHRALMISALAGGVSTIEGLSSGTDVAATQRIIAQLGAVTSDGDGLTTVRGPAEGLHASDSALDCANSGTTMRLLAGIVSTIPGDHVLVGDESLSRRPMDRIAMPLALMGSRVEGVGSRTTAPLTVRGPSALRALTYRVPLASAQVKSAILFAGLGATGTTTVIEDVRTRSTTEDMLRLAGLDITSLDHGDGRTVTLVPGRPQPRHWRVPGDPSQAAFFAVLGAIHRDARIKVMDIDSAPERIGFVAVLRRMGATIALVTTGGVTSLTAESSKLRGTEVHADEVPSVDEVPVLVVAAAAASGVSSFRGMGELRLKESDRFVGSMALASSLGCRVWADGDDFFVEGLSDARSFGDFTFDVLLDHRMVMSSAVAGAAGRGCTIAGSQTVASSYTDFFTDLAALG